ncbi:MAG: hypothetical protein ABI844_11045 [Saprospiraceae bacterium]
MNNQWTRKLFILTTAGFIILFSISIINYPGGTPHNIATKGFHFKENYLCNLLNPKGINGEPNPTYILAISGSFLLALSFIITFLAIPQYLRLDDPVKNLIIWSGIAGMLLAPFIFTSYHDVLINWAGFLGTIAFCPAFYHLYLQKKYWNIFWGITGLSCCGVTYLIYQSHIFFDLLAITQKLSLVSLLIWQIHLHYIYRRA